MKIYLSNLNESWVVDRFREDWYNYNSDISTENISDASIVWIVSPWVWKNNSKRKLNQKKVVCSIYHIDFKTFSKKEERDFYKRDKFVDFYHVISNTTKKQLETLTDKSIISIPFWVDSKIFKELENKNILREKYGFSRKDYLIGSFQRDSEGKDVSLPKLIKGPDIFFKIVKKEFYRNQNLKVVLTGKRRDYLITKLEEAKIPYKYFEMIEMKGINELYNILDLYLVTSRVEGGPQAIMECALTKTPIISTNVGIAQEILSEESVFKNEEDFNFAKPNVEIAYSNAVKHTIPDGMKKFREMFEGNFES